MFGMGHTKFINMLLFTVKVATGSHLFISNYTTVCPVIMAWNSWWAVDWEGR